MPSRIQPNAEVREAWTSDQGSMAQEAVQRVWPSIVQDMIDQVQQSASTKTKEEQKDAVTIVKSLSEMRSEMEQNRPLT